MKSLIRTHLAIVLLTSLEVSSQQYSDITYDAGTSIEIQSGADVCATNIIINGTFSGTGTICSGPLPVELLSFTYSAKKNSVMLNWNTAFELNNSGFDIERGAVTKNGIQRWLKTGFVQGRGTTNESMEYSFEDKKMRAGTYRYRLKQIDFNGGFEYFELTQEVKIEPPVNFFIGQNYPNPSNPKSKIDYETPVYGRVTIKLYNLLGQEVLNIVNEIMDAGYYTAEFDGTSLASGAYFYRITIDGSSMNFTKTLKMVLVK